MKSPLRWSLITLIAAIVTHFYATSNYYSLKLGLGEKSSCNINALFNCDLITASSYSSFFGIPMSLWGASTNLVVFILLSMVLFGLSEQRQKLLRWSYVFAGFILLMSIIMGLASAIFLSTFCTSCITSYILSILSFELIRRSQEGPFLKPLLDDIKSVSTNLMFFSTLLLSIPLLATVTHFGILNHHQAGNLSTVVKHAIIDWKQNPKVEFLSSPSLSYGPHDSKIVIVEFADFLCGHCKQAMPSLDAFKKSHKNVLFKFYSFPLDGACNSLISRSNGVSCRLAKATLCAENQKLGWRMHDVIFENQIMLSGQSKESIDTPLKKWTQELGGQWDPLLSCMESEETQTHITQQVQQAEVAKVRGTPTIYFNGRILPKAQLLPVLEAAYDETLK